ncbi:Aldolase-II domain-containing protein [Mycena sanguinolenta]|uniref:Aldolase-II domain-containing protein n=1 Tax=Mycena sanguinolenta TaxID=230812 RepID=A0A8H6XZW2_9AGAR|nr:Aldolase-II domain-containing protein [Mycena sanguinolenta]
MVELNWRNGCFEPARRAGVNDLIEIGNCSHSLPRPTLHPDPSILGLKMSGAHANSLENAHSGKFPTPPAFATKLEEREFLKFRLAQALRMFGNHGFDEGPAGHITVRDPILPRVLLDHQGQILDESGQKDGPFRILNMAAFMIHSAIHAARPDVICAAHSHSTYGKAFSSLGKMLDPISQDSCSFYEDHVVYTQFNGIVLEEAEGLAIAKALGNKKAAILQNHGLLVVGSTIESTIRSYISLERACQVQLLAEATGTPLKINHAQAKETAKIIGNQRAGWFSGTMEFMVLEREEGVKFHASE